MTSRAFSMSTRIPTSCPASARSSTSRKRSMPLTGRAIVSPLVSGMQTLSPIAIEPESIRPVRKTPRPVIVNVSLIGILKLLLSLCWEYKGKVTIVAASTQTRLPLRAYENIRTIVYMTVAGCICNRCDPARDKPGLRWALGKPGKL